jgi:hypothetical protein
MDKCKADLESWSLKSFENELLKKHRSDEYFLLFHLFESTYIQVTKIALQWNVMVIKCHDCPLSSILMDHVTGKFLIDANAEHISPE